MIFREGEADELGRVAGQRDGAVERNPVPEAIMAMTFFRRNPARVAISRSVRGEAAMASCKTWATVFLVVIVFSCQ